MFLDFTHDQICYNKTYFYNTTHMNIQGAERFTKELCQKIKMASPSQYPN
jgi:hypothetical protein